MNDLVLQLSDTRSASSANSWYVLKLMIRHSLFPALARPLSRLRENPAIDVRISLDEAGT